MISIENILDTYTYTSDILNYLMKNEKIEIKYISELDKLNYLVTTSCSVDSLQKNGEGKSIQ